MVPFLAAVVLYGVVPDIGVLALVLLKISVDIAGLVDCHKMKMAGKILLIAFRRKRQGKHRLPGKEGIVINDLMEQGIPDDGIDGNYRNEVVVGDLPEEFLLGTYADDPIDILGLGSIRVGSKDHVDPGSMEGFRKTGDDDERICKAEQGIAALDVDGYGIAMPGNQGFGSRIHAVMVKISNLQNLLLGSIADLLILAVVENIRDSCGRYARFLRNLLDGNFLSCHYVYYTLD